MTSNWLSLPPRTFDRKPPKRQPPPAPLSLFPELGPAPAAPEPTAGPETGDLLALLEDA